MYSVQALNKELWIIPTSSFFGVLTVYTAFCESHPTPLNNRLKSKALTCHWSDVYLWLGLHPPVSSRCKTEAASRHTGTLSLTILSGAVWSCVTLPCGTSTGVVWYPVTLLCGALSYRIRYIVTLSWGILSTMIWYRVTLLCGTLSDVILSCGVSSRVILPGAILSSGSLSLLHCFVELLPRVISSC